MVLTGYRGMSYCRWSSDNMRSDVYAYEDCMGGYTVHVRGVHPVNPEILPEFPTKAFKELDTEAVQEWLDKKREAHPNLIYEDNNLPYDDQTFRIDDIEELYETLVYLRDTGYHVPKSVFEMIQEEIE